jgi:uncharacterized protein YeaO (DUF488 family)
MQRPIIKRLAGPMTTARAAMHEPRRAIAVKRASESSSIDDGMRVLVDRQWPPGLSKEQVGIDLWLKEAAPSEALRRWYGRDPRRWESFVERYRAELEQRGDLLRLLDELRRTCPVTLVYGVRDASRNNAVVLREVLTGSRVARRHMQARS